MSWNAFIFSTDSADTRRRHVAFWFIYSIAFFAQSIAPIQYADFSGKALYVQALISLLCYLPVCLYSVYAFHFFLLKYLQTNRLATCAFRFTGVLLSVYILSLIASSIFSKWICSCPMETISSGKLLGLTFINSSHAIVIGMVILGFSFTKKWILDQKEIKNLKKQKIQNELQTFKANMYPDFLLQSLNSIRKKVREDRSGHSKMLIKLSDLLSYILYECKQETVPLKREISMIEKLIEIEQVNKSAFLNISFRWEGDSKYFTIKSLLLFPLLHNYLSCLVTEPQEIFHCLIDIHLKENNLHIHLLTSPGISSDTGLLDTFNSRMMDKLNHLLCVNLPPEIIVDKNQSILSLIIPLTIFKQTGFQNTESLELNYS